MKSPFQQPTVKSQTSVTTMKWSSSTDSVVERERWRSSTGLTSSKWISRSSVQQENTGEARGGRKREQEKQEVGLGGGRSLARKESRKELGGDVVKGKERREGSVRKPLQDLTQSTRRASLGAPQVIIILDKTLLILIFFNLHVSSLSVIPSSWPHTLSPSHFTCPSPPPLASFPPPFQVWTQRLELSVGAKHPIARGPPLATPALLKTLQGPGKAPARKGPASSSRAIKWEETRAPVQKEGTAVSRALLRENVGVLQREKPRVLQRAGSSVVLDLRTQTSRSESLVARSYRT